MDKRGVNNVLGNKTTIITILFIFELNKTTYDETTGNYFNGAGYFGVSCLY
ncbi:MAG TPA: hypothetical protein VN922_24420 [Bacteroidia bacterium]|nr:hypothetical protein [Bacteroidia bacterium]